MGGESVARIAAALPARRRAIGQHLFDGVRAGRAVETHITDAGDFAQAQLGIFGPQIDDGLAHRWWQGPMVILLLAERRVEEADHALGLEPVRLPTQGSLDRSGLLGTFGGGVPEQHNRTHQFVGALLWPQTLLPHGVPHFRMGTARACWHETPPPHWTSPNGDGPL